MRNTKRNLVSVGAHLCTTAMLAAAITFLGAPHTAQACGGFFCFNQPIDQAGEEIIFSTNKDDESVRAIVRISYQGEAEAFAWVLPVQSVPEVSVSVDRVFTVVRNTTQPRFSVTWINEDAMCFEPWWFYGPEMAPSADSEGGGVTVVDAGQAGPYDYAILESDNSSALIGWLNENDFTQPPESHDLIAHYVEEGMKFVAIKLQQNMGTGDIAPLVLDMPEGDPCVPLVLTQIAAQPDMPVRVWVLGEARAVPNNWFHVDLNWKKLNWLDSGNNYTQLVTDAVNEAAGHGFVTEYAGSPDLLDNFLYNDTTADPFGLETLKELTSPIEFLQNLLFGPFSAMPETLNLLRKHLPLPEEAAGQELFAYAQPWDYEEHFNSLDFDPEAFVKDLDEVIVTPLREAQDMFDAQPYLTRMFSTVSPEEMNRDPIFGYNSDLGDVSHIHEATGEVICNDENIKTILLTLPNGDVMTAALPDWVGEEQPEEVDDYSDEPSAASVAMVGETGAPLPVNKDYVEYFDNQLAHTPVAELIEDTENQPGGVNNPITDDGEAVVGADLPKDSSGSGCANTQTSPLPFAAILAVFAGLLLVVRRRQSDWR